MAIQGQFEKIFRILLKRVLSSHSVLNDFWNYSYRQVRPDIRDEIR
jgi:hypothetical protein